MPFNEIRKAVGVMSAMILILCIVLLFVYDWSSGFSWEPILYPCIPLVISILCLRNSGASISKEAKSFIGVLFFIIFLLLSTLIVFLYDWDRGFSWGLIAFPTVPFILSLLFMYSSISFEVEDKFKKYIHKRFSFVPIIRGLIIMFVGGGSTLTLSLYNEDRNYNEAMFCSIFVFAYGAFVFSCFIQELCMKCDHPLHDKNVDKESDFLVGLGISSTYLDDASLSFKYCEHCNHYMVLKTSQYDFLLENDVAKLVHEKLKTS